MFWDIHKNNKRCSQLRCPENFKSKRWFLTSRESVLWNSLSLRKEILSSAEIYERNNLFLKNAVSWEQKHSPKYVWWLLLQLSFSWINNTAVECDYRNYLKTSELMNLIYILKIGDIIYFCKKKYDGRKNWQKDYLNKQRN